MIEPGDIRRLNLGYYTMPSDSRLAGQKIACCAYLVRYPGGLLLFDTGIGVGHAEADSEFGPMLRQPLQAELSRIGLRLSDVSTVANCHLHLDHCGNNQLFPGTPIFVQQQELDALPSLDYVLPEMVHFAGAALEIHDGEADIAAGLRIIPTLGHTPGHQSLLVETTRGKILVAGHAADSASDYGRAQFSLDVAAAEAAPASPAPAWQSAMQGLGSRLALFAHDLTAWDRDQAAAQVPRLAAR